MCHVPDACMPVRRPPMLPLSLGSVQCSRNILIFGNRRFFANIKVASIFSLLLVFVGSPHRVVMVRPIRMALKWIRTCVWCISHCEYCNNDYFLRRNRHRRIVCNKALDAPLGRCKNKHRHSHTRERLRLVNRMWERHEPTENAHCTLHGSDGRCRAHCGRSQITRCI